MSDDMTELGASESAIVRVREKIGDLSKDLAKHVKPYEGEPHHADQMTNVRRFVHEGRECMIETHYKISVDGEPLAGHLSVNSRGGVHHHGLPNYTFPSAIDLVKALLSSSKYQIDDEDELAAIYEGGGK